MANHAKTVLQSPDDLIKNQNESSVIVCSHNIQNYNRMLWYKQSQDMTGLKFMGYLFTNENIEPEFTNKIKLEGDAKRNGTLDYQQPRTRRQRSVFLCCILHSDIDNETLIQKAL